MDVGWYCGTLLQVDRSLWVSAKDKTSLGLFHRSVNLLVVCLRGLLHKIFLVLLKFDNVVWKAHEDDSNDSFGLSVSLWLIRCCW